MNNISFQGNIRVTTWDATKSALKEYQTTEAQDKLIKKIANKMSEPGVVTPLPRRSAGIFHEIIERIINKPIRNINNDKIIYNDDNIMVFSDRNPALFDGVRVEIDFN